MRTDTAVRIALAGAALISVFVIAPDRASALPATAQEHSTTVLSASPTCDRSPGTPPVKPGDTGKAVKELQCLLAYCGYYNGPINGSYNSALRQAILHYQRDHNLPPDGTVGPRMWAQLRAGEC